jgi:hypothetical protein
MTSLDLEIIESKGAILGFTTGFCGNCEILGGYFINDNCVCLNGFVSMTALFTTCEQFPDSHNDIFTS